MFLPTFRQSQQILAECPVEFVILVNSCTCK